MSVFFAKLASFAKPRDKPSKRRRFVQIFGRFLQGEIDSYQDALNSTMQPYPVRSSEHIPQVCTDLNCLCYNPFTGQGQLLWVGVCLSYTFGPRFSLVSMVSINFGIRFYGVETGDTGESIEPEESH